MATTIRPDEAPARLGKPEDTSSPAIADPGPGRAGSCLDELQAGAAASGHVAERVLGQAERADGRAGVTATDHGERLAVGESPGHGPRH